MESYRHLLCPGMESDRHFVFEEWGLDDTYQIGHDIRFEHKFGIKTHWYKR